MCWGAFPRMLSSCDYRSRPGHLFWSDRWNPLCALAWVLCVCTCACVHSCLNSGHPLSSAAGLGPHPHQIVLCISIWTSFWLKTKATTRWQAAQAGPHSFGRMSAQTNPETSPWTLFGTLLGKRADRRLGLADCRPGRGERRRQHALHLCLSACSRVRAGLSTASLAWSSGDGGHPDILRWSLERC